ncbi:MAG: S-adenosylmethionine:tRNA ribosyltransferase-isomerase [Patescibacteria group bacterium]|jgi:S-adenosylmethionine:tRNA ribosyltransferase-isomerase|nr:S-adenosylmethionine:tRNA ribosyltransferase-isomerase [Patescibacteria group bacterium]
MNISDFDFELPSTLIAQNPAEPRDSAKLLVYDRLSDSIEHSTVGNINAFLPDQTVLVANNSRVRKSRLFAVCADRDIEVLILEQIENASYRCLIRGRGLVAGDIMHFIRSKEDFSPIPLHGRIEKKEPHESMTTFVISFWSETGKSLEELFLEYGNIPLPPYITESNAASERYQTVFSDQVGSAAAPTAGLHFTPELIESLKNAGHPWHEVTLHVGMGTFLPLRNDKITENKLHFEKTFVSEEVADSLHEARAAGKRIMAVGTTSTRTLESHSGSEEIKSGYLDTNLFIYPGYTFKTVNTLMTNFHLPHSSLLVLVAAFLGNHPEQKEVCMEQEEMIRRLQTIYRIAIEHNYRFYSFGDAMLIL